MSETPPYPACTVCDAPVMCGQGDHHLSCEARVLSVTDDTPHRQVLVACPHCHRTHTHGWPYTDPTIGHRVAHCGGPEYLIPTPKETDYV